VDSSDAVPSRNARPGYSARDVVRVPGLLSLARLPLAVAFPFVYRNSTHAIAILALAALSDVLDGWYARVFHQQTFTGAVLDGFMDKVLAVAVLLTLVLGGELSAVEAVVLSTREVGEVLLVAVALAVLPRRAAAAHPANAIGKLATVLQFVTVVLVLLRRGPRRLFVLATGISGAAAAVAYGIRELQVRTGEAQAR
jgi:phosphatidylglycerophosphate synthase